jgi:hypothetical protein
MKKNDLYLGQHFTLSEFTKSVTAKRLGIDNVPSSEDIVNLLYLTQHVLDPIRTNLSEPIIITSGFRNDKLNTAIGGSLISQHRLGQAADIELASGWNANIFNYAINKLDFDQLIWEFGDDQDPDWVHISYTLDGNRREVLRATKTKGGETHYATHVKKSV